MILAIKKLNNSIYIDKTFLERFGEDKLKEYGYIAVVIDDKYLDCKTNDFNDDLTFNVEKYNNRKLKEKYIDYETLIVSKIREKYTLDQELAILRQRDSKPQEFAEYDAYVEQCKLEAKTEVSNGNK